MGIVRNRAVLVDPMKIVAAMYAARQFAEEADRYLSIAGQGLARTGIDLGLREKLRMLVDRLKDLPTTQD